MPSLSSSISLALATKLKFLFETSADKFLSFPVRLAYPTSFFSFMQPDGGLSAVDQEKNKLEFARFTNCLPDNTSSFPHDTDKLLWDVYKKVLTESVFADSTLTPTQHEQLSQAIDFLTDKQVVDGVEVTVPSAALLTYYQYKTVYDDINRQYIDEKLTVEFAATDEEGKRLRELWAAVQEKAWLDQLKAAEDNWVNIGQRDTVNFYQSLRADLEPKRFPLQFKTACQNDLALGELPDLNANGVLGGYVTFFSPNNAFQSQSPWQHLTLSKAEIISLAAQAPAELSAKFGNGQADDAIERLSFEYNKVVLVRPWLKADFFRAHSWKLPNNEVLSDGSIPGRGLLPAYTSSLIVVRNIRVTRRKTASVTQPLVIPILSNVKMGTFVARQPSAPVAAKPKPWVMMRLGATIFAKPLIQAGKISDPVIEADMPARVLSKVPVQHLKMQRATYLHSTIVTPVRNRPEVAQPIKTVQPIWAGPIGAGTRPTPTPIQTVEEKFDFDGVVILAFECVRLPKSPDPDLSLPWI